MSKPHARDLAALDALYAQLPRVQCVGKCGGSCGPIPMALIEARRLRMVSGKKPTTTGTGRDERCVYLRNGRCSVYHVRPLICRVWGTAKSLSCMYGCKPDRWLSLAEFVEIGKQIERLGGPNIVTTNGDPRPVEDYATRTLPNDPEARAFVARSEELTRTARALLGGYAYGAIPTDDDR